METYFPDESPEQKSTIDDLIARKVKDSTNDY
jgi:hypothetical protein